MPETRRESGSWKTKHSRILVAALDEFIDCGFIGGSMDRIALKAKVSKVTIYNHFESKDQLYQLVLEYYLSQVYPGAPSLAMSRELEPKEILTRYANDLIAVATSQRSIGMLRLLRSQPLLHGEVPPAHHAAKLLPDMQAMSSYFAWEHGNGRLKVANPQIAACQFTGMLFENTLYPSLMGLKVDLSKARVGEVIETSVNMVLSYYANS